MLMQIYKNSELIKNFWGGHGQEWVCPVWSQGTKIDYISKANLHMLVEIQESLKLIQWF